MAIRFRACDNERNGKSSPTENMARRPLGPTTVNTVQSSSYATENAASTNLMVSWISRRRERCSPTSSWLPEDGSAGYETVNTVATDEAISLLAVTDFPLQALRPSTKTTMVESTIQ